MLCAATSQQAFPRRNESVEVESFPIIEASPEHSLSRMLTPSTRFGPRSTGE
jgi:hypothetical protein